jgi:hypothetical protein
MTRKLDLSDPSTVLNRLEYEQKVAERIETEGDALDFLKGVYQNPELDLHARMKAAGIAIEYERPRLAMTALVNGEDFAKRLDRAVARSTTAKVISPPKVRSIAEEIDAIEPIVTVPDKRYRRS